MNVVVCVLCGCTAPSATACLCTRLWHAPAYPEMRVLSGWYRMCVQILAAVPELCRELGKEAVSLVDAFGIPDHLLAAPIAADWVDFNRVDNRGELTGSKW